MHVARALRHVDLHRRVDAADDHREERVAARPRELPERLASAVEAGEITKAQAQRFVAQFVGSVNLYQSSFTRAASALHFSSLAIGEVALPATLEPPGAQGEIAFRPHAIRITAGSAAAKDGEMRFTGTIEGE